MMLKALIIVFFAILSSIRSAQAQTQCEGDLSTWDQCVGSGTFKNQEDPLFGDTVFGYTGPWEKGKPNGRGFALYRKNGVKLTYRGSFENGIRSGHGRLDVEDDGYFEGYWLNGKQNGRGVRVYANGVRYEGEYKDGQKHGQGVSSVPDGATYTGEHRDGKANGYGIWEFPEGDMYIGDNENGVPHGSGVYYFANGDIYTGAFSDAERNGRGVYEWANGDRHEGGYFQNLKHGFGKISFANGGSYEGNFTRDQYNGYGVLDFPNGDKYIGQFDDNLYQGEGAYIYANGDRYEGQFKSGKANGSGDIQFSNGDRFSGIFESDRLGVGKAIVGGREIKARVKWSDPGGWVIEELKKTSLTSNENFETSSTDDRDEFVEGCRVGLIEALSGRGLEEQFRKFGLNDEQIPAAIKYNRTILSYESVQTSVCNRLYFMYMQDRESFVMQIERFLSDSSYASDFLWEKFSPVIFDEINSVFIVGIRRINPSNLTPYFTYSARLFRYLDPQTCRTLVAENKIENPMLIFKAIPKIDFGITDAYFNLVTKASVAEFENSPVWPPIPRIEYEDIGGKFGTHAYEYVSTNYNDETVELVVKLMLGDIGGISDEDVCESVAVMMEAISAMPGVDGDKYRKIIVDQFSPISTIQ